MVNEEGANKNRDIIIRKRDGQLHKIIETNIAYDGLQYPLLFVRGEDGYHFETYQWNVQREQYTNQKVSCCDFYAYRIMVRSHGKDHILHCRELFDQFIMDMGAKVIE